MYIKPKIKSTSSSELTEVMGPLQTAYVDLSFQQVVAENQMNTLQVVKVAEEIQKDMPVIYKGKVEHA